MGRASSSKKVARAARAAGAGHKRRRKLAFPLTIVAIVVVGTLLVVYARKGAETASAETPKVGDHWHAAYGFYVCDKFLPPLTDAVADTTGIHTHGDAIMHVHPFADGSAGRNATFSVWGKSENVTFGKDSITLPDGTVLKDGYDCNGQPATLSVYQWSILDPNADPTIYTKDFGSIHYSEEGLIFTIALVPEGTTVPKPDSVQRLQDLLTGVASEDPTEATTGTTTVGTTPAGATDSTAPASAGASASTPSSTPAAAAPSSVAPSGQ